MIIKDEYINGPNSIYYFAPSKSDESIQGVVLYYKNGEKKGQPVYFIPPKHLDFYKLPRFESPR